MTFYKISPLVDDLNVMLCMTVNHDFAPYLLLYMYDDFLSLHVRFNIVLTGNVVCKDSRG